MDIHSCHSHIQYSSGSCHCSQKKTLEPAKEGLGPCLPLSIIFHSPAWFGQQCWTPRGLQNMLSFPALLCTWNFCREHHLHLLTSSFIFYIQSRQSSPPTFEASPSRDVSSVIHPGFPRWIKPGSWDLPTSQVGLPRYPLQVSHPSYTAFSFYTGVRLYILKWFT